MAIGQRGRPAKVTGHAWIEQIFQAGQASKQGVVRRSVKSVQECASEKSLLDAVKNRGFHMARTRGQYIIFCYQEDFKWFS